MNRNYLVALAAAALVAAAIWLWLGRGSDGRQGDPSRLPAAGSVHGDVAGSDARASRIDPRRKKRGRISGTVWSDTGGGIADARVCATLQSDELGSEETREPICADTSGDGSYVLSNLIEGTYWIYAGAPGYIADRYDGPDREPRLELEAGEHREGVDLGLKKGGVELRGVVKDIGGGPVAGALVSVNNDRLWHLHAGLTRSDDRGEFILRVEPGEVEVIASADGYADGEKEGIAPDQYIEVLLTPESVLAGVVVEAGSGRPVAGAHVHVGGYDWNSLGGDDDETSQASAITDQDGRFRITRLLPARYKPVATAVGRQGQTAYSVLLGLGQVRDDLVIEIHPGHIITGRILIAAAGEKPKPCQHGALNLVDEVNGRRARTATGPDGSIFVDAVFPGTYQVTALCDKHLSQKEYPEIVVADRDVVDQVWQVGVGARITGRVVDRQKRPIAGASVAARSEDSDWRSHGRSESRDDGRFEITGLPAATYGVEAEAKGYPEPEEAPIVTLGAGQHKEIELVLDTGGTIRGSVVDQNGEPVVGVSVRASHGAILDLWDTATRSNGTFELTGLPPGLFEVEALRGGEALRKPGTTRRFFTGEEVIVAIGQVAEVELVVELPKGQITGQVVDENGEPVVDAFVSASLDMGDTSGLDAMLFVRWTFGDDVQLTDTEGNFAIGNLYPNEYAIRAYRRGGGEGFVRGVKVDSHATVVILPTGSLAGTVSSGDGRIPDELSVYVEDSQTRLIRSESFFRVGGRWLIGDLPAGNFLVVVQSDDGIAWQRVSLAEGEDRAGLVFKLKPFARITGRIVTGDLGKPMSDVLVELRPVEWGSGLAGSRFPWADDQRDTTEEDGRFEIRRAPTGKVELDLLGRRVLDYDHDGHVLTIPAGQTHDVGDIELNPRQRFRRWDRD